MQILKFIITINFLLASLFGSSQFFKKKVNQLNKDGQKEGVWIDYWDEEQAVVMSKTYYLNGHESRVCKNYHSNGKLRLKFRYQSDRIRVKMFDEDGNLIQKGWAVFEITENEVHYYYHGPWKEFNETRKLIATYIYKNGFLIED